eukprot:TRINITY_DN767_c0_g2_i2.p1 TRINITY_DN767_c0_g2~~TRINITY_DN767_c0_g2_i2.p1  ORF type:complete len:2036 (+),score=672.00 TRINITY_DN767_c0_g2_i2:48-6110(+)
MGTKRRDSTGESKDDKTVKKARKSGDTNATSGADADTPFPRGGASALSNLELREVRAEAERDFLFEVASDKKGKKKSKTDKSSRRSRGSDKVDAASSTTAVTKRIDGLSFRRLKQGMVLLGIVRESTDFDMSVQLPNNLTGFVSATDISDTYSTLLEAEANADDSDSDDDSSSGSSSASDKGQALGAGLRVRATPLSDMYKPGDVVRCVVIKTDAQRKNRVELSINPSLVNIGIDANAVSKGMTLTAAIKSIEDHGYVISYSNDLNGFIYKRDMEAFLDDGARQVYTGQVIETAVISFKDKVIRASADPGKVCESMTTSNGEVTIETLKAGMRVTATLAQVYTQGLQVSFMGFTGTVDLFHVDPDLEIEDKAKMQARILYVDSTRKRIGLSLLRHIVGNHTFEFPSELDIGTVIPEATVTRIDSGHGVLLAFTAEQGDTVHAYAHITRAMADIHDKLEKHYRLNQRVKARIVGFSGIDGIAHVTLRKDVIEQPLMRHQDVKPGMVVRGKIIAVESFGLIVQLTDSIKGLVSVMHLADTRLKHFEKKFQVGLKVKCKVLSVDVHKRRIHLTMKKSLLNSDLPDITSMSEAKPGVVSHGVITAVKPFGLVVTFYNNVHGLVPKREASVSRVADLNEMFSLGQVHATRVVAVTGTSANKDEDDDDDDSRKRLLLSFKMGQAAEGLPGDSEEVRTLAQGSAYAVGTIHSATVVQRVGANFLVKIGDQGVTALLAPAQLSDYPQHVQAIANQLKEGVVVGEVMVMEAAHGKHRPVVTAKSALIRHAQTGKSSSKKKKSTAFPSSISGYKANTVVPGFIRNVVPYGVFVGFPNGVTGLCLKNNCADEYVSDPATRYEVGQTVYAFVVSCDNDKLSLSLKQSTVGVDHEREIASLRAWFAEEDSYLPSKGSADWSQYCPGSLHPVVSGLVSAYGTSFKVTDAEKLEGFAVNHHTPGMKFKSGSKHTAVVLDASRHSGVVDLSLRPEIVQAAEKAKGGAGAQDTGRSTRRSTRKSSLEEQEPALKLKKGQTTKAVVQLVKDAYIIVSLPEHGHVLAIASGLYDVNARKEGLPSKFKIGQSVTVAFYASPDPSNTEDDPLASRFVVCVTDADGGSGVTTGKATKNQPFVDPSIQSADDITVGRIVKARIIAVKQSQLHITLGKRHRGRIHISEVVDEVDGSNPLAQFSPQDLVTARILQIHERQDVSGTAGDDGPTLQYEMSLRPSVLALKPNAKMPAPLSDISKLKKGTKLNGFIRRVAPDGLWVTLSPTVKGRVFVLDVAQSLEVLRSLPEHFSPGQGLVVHVLGTDKERHTVDLSVIKPVSDSLAANSIVSGRVSKIDSMFMSVQVGAHKFGRVHITNANDKFVSHPFSKYSTGDFIRCAVLSHSKNMGQIDLSLRASDTGGHASSKAGARIQSIKDLKADTVVTGYVKDISKKGCFVAVAPKIDIHVRISNLSDDYVRDVESAFKPGQLVQVRVLGVDLAQRRAEGSLKDSAINPDKKRIEFSDLSVGTVVTGQVRRVEKYGIFINIDHSNMNGLCHISEIKEEKVTDIAALGYHPGDRVKAAIIKLDPSSKKISLSLKKELVLDGEPLTGVDSDGDDDDSDAMSVDDDDDGDGDQSASDSDDSDDEEDEDVEEEAGSDNDDQDDASIDDGDSADSGSDSEAEEEEEEETRTSRKRKHLEVDGGLAWDDDEQNTMFDGDSDEGSGGAAGDNDAQDKSAARAAKRQKREQKEKDQKSLRQMENTLAQAKKADAAAQQQQGESADDYEKLILASPNSSYVWIKYMAFQLSLGEVDKARAIGERALKTIHFREEGEKLNMWTALLNLEATHGYDDSFSRVFKDASMYNNAKQVHMRAIDILARVKNDKMLETIFAAASRKFKQSKQVWIRQGLHKFEHEDAEGARKVLQRALEVLPRRKHIPTIIKFAIMEFKIGSAERGRTIFESVLANYPKRVDLWSVYLDMEIKNGDLELVRQLFQRTITLPLSVKKVKFFFKRYLEFEKMEGTPETVEGVKDKAREYVESKANQ